MKVVEFFSGLGGFSAALGEGHQVLAVDQNLIAARVYRANYPHQLLTKTVESLDQSALRAFNAHMWWASPPCQPYTTKGRQRQLADRRTGGFIALLNLLSACRPPFFAMENVVGFRQSHGHRLVRQILDAGGYRFYWEGVLCSSQFGIPNRRPRFFLVAGRKPLADASPALFNPRPLTAFLQGETPGSFDLSMRHLTRFRKAMNLIHENDPHGVTSCFTAGYGRSAVRCGSYLIRPDGRVRHVTPTEIAALLGLPNSFQACR